LILELGADTHPDYTTELYRTYAMVYSLRMDSLRMDVIKFTRELVDIESISGNEGQVGDFLCAELAKLGFYSEKLPIEGQRSNVWASWPEEPRPALVFSTHMDTVPPHILSSEDDYRVYGRGSCDAKGIIAAQTSAAQRLRNEGIRVGLLFLVGEERDSLGAKVANRQPRGAKFMVNGEPTENRVAIASKGSLRAEVVARGKMAHSAYPELGESAIDKLIQALARLRVMKLPTNPEVGPCTLNIGLIEGGRAPNVIPDHAKLSARRAGGRIAPRNPASSSRFGRSKFHFGNSVYEATHLGWLAHDGGSFHHRYSGPQRLGTTIATWPGIHSRGPHRTGVRGKKSAHRSH
jgi:hypothetical protein